MANLTIGSVMIREIIKLKNQDVSHSRISQITSKSRTTILKYVEKIEHSALPLEDLLQLSDSELVELFEVDADLIYNSTLRAKIRKTLYDFFPYVDKELKRVGVSRHLLWLEYKELNSDGVMYSQFCDHYCQWNKKSEGYMPIEHKAGDKLFIDYAGKKLYITSPDTGEVVPVEVFIGTLGASQYTYVEATFTQRIPDFISSVQNCLEYIGGVPQCIVPDNLKSAVTKANKYEPFISEQFASFSVHYNTAIIPARPRKPKDKPLVEGAVNIVYTRIYAMLRNKVFFTIEALNSAIRELLLTYNRAQFQKRKISREALFLEIEKDTLQALPTNRYELNEYRVATVQKNCHVYNPLDKNYYSVPYNYIGKKVKLILTQSIVEIYYERNRLATHTRSHKPYAYITQKEHLPVNHRYKSEWTPEYFLSWAESIGEPVRACIENILQKKQHPEQGYKSCLGILTFAKKVGKERLIAACLRAFSYQAISYTHIKNILDKGLDKQLDLPNLFSLPIIEHENIRGTSYYN